MEVVDYLIIVASVEQKVKSSKAYIFEAQESNYFIPLALTNFVAWVSRVGDDFRVHFHGKAILNVIRYSLEN